MNVTAKWIWKKQQDYGKYNQTIIARKVLHLSQVTHANIIITADSFYRLSINGQWVNDGPCRSWPEHYQYDKMDVTPYLKTGANEIKVIARYYGVGDFHRVPQQAGLLVQIDIKQSNGKTKTIITDKTWEVAEAMSWIPDTPKISIQMEPVEFYDARLENKARYREATVLFDAVDGPWKNLNSRDVALMTKEPFAFNSFSGCHIVKNNSVNFTLPAARLTHPGIIEANYHASTPCGMASVLKAKKGISISLHAVGFKFSVDGRVNTSGRYDLSKGEHLILALSDNLCSMHSKEKVLNLTNVSGVKLTNPVKPKHYNPWCLIKLEEFVLLKNDLYFYHFTHEIENIQKAISDYAKITDKLLKTISDKKTFVQCLEGKTKCLPFNKMFVNDFQWLFDNRLPQKNTLPQIENPAALIYDNCEMTVIKPSKKGDVELIYDLGEQNCGYYNFDLIAQAGVSIDINQVEYITEEGKIQHTRSNRNGMRYITKDGGNRFTSLKRRSGRYIFITLRNFTSPVKIRHFNIIESTYPVNDQGSFACSDSALNKIWEISARTLKLCMEDTYTDCPLYEQTFWVGDARNESLYGYSVFGAEDLAARCIKLAAQSLERYPIVGCQVPSSWDCLLPAWSFLWGISVWDYYWHTGDEKFLKKLWPAVVKNLNGAKSLIDSQTGLFSAPFWNMFDWTEIDQQQKTVLHNSMLLVGAIDAAIKCLEVLEDGNNSKWLKDFRKVLKKSINHFWDNNTRSYPDSIHADHTVSKSTSQHTSFLSILYDIIKSENKKDAIKNILNPSEEIIGIGSPFAMQYLYETFEKEGFDGKIIESIYKNFIPMLNTGATTVWETFPTGTMAWGEFPTRSHCHAWSSSPLYFLNRIVLGIRQTKAGGKSFEISPRLCGNKWAKGVTYSQKGPISVAWKIKSKTLKVNIKAPEGVEIKFVRNPTHKGLRIAFNHLANSTSKRNKC